MRKSRYQMKRFAVMILSACLVLQQGAVSTLAAETGPGVAEEAAVESDVVIAQAAETASASDAVPAETASAAAKAAETTSAAEKDAEQTASAAAENAGSAAEEATSSNAMFDEEGSLLDGGVIQDVPVEAEEELLPEAELIDEIIPAPETKTEILDPQRATIWTWLDDYEYTLDLENHCVVLEKYNGTDTELVITGEEQFGSEFYPIVIGPTENMQSIWYPVRNTLKSLVFEDGVKLPENSSFLFSGLTALEHLDLSGADTSSVVDMNYMFYDCESLTELDLSSFDTSAVNSMGNMFAYCMALKHVDVSSFDTSQVTDVYCMFRDCQSVTDLDLSSFDLSRITRYDGMLFSLNDLQTLHTPYNNKAELDLYTGKYDKTGQIYYRIPAGTKQSLFLTNEPSYISVTGIRINTSQRTIVPGKTFQLAAWPQPTDAAFRGVTWRSSDSSVASVNSSGLVTAVRNGTATITAKTVDGGYTASCVITVGIPVTSVKINAAEKVVAPGKTFQLAAWPQPANAANKAVTWTSSNTSVAKVSSSGLVTAVSEGTATITVKTVDGGKTATCAITVGVPVTSVKINSTSVMK